MHLGSDFLQGWMTYEDHYSASTGKRIVLPVHLGHGGHSPVPMIVDTGSPWNIIDPEIAEMAGLVENADDVDHILVIRGDRRRGRLMRGGVTLKAEEGEDLNAEGIFFVPLLPVGDFWEHPSFIGYGGLLEWIRFAVDPFVNRFYFGSP